MIKRHRRDHGGERAFDHVGRVEPSAETDLQQQHIGSMAGEQEERRRRLDLEHGDRRCAVDGLALR